jgi:hypothetical protein
MTICDWHPLNPAWLGTGCVRQCVLPPDIHPFHAFYLKILPSGMFCHVFVIIAGYFDDGQ